MLRTQRFKRFAALVLIASLMCMSISSCKKKDASETSADTTSATTTEESTTASESEETTEETRRRTVVEVEDLDAIMTAVGRGIIRDDPSLQGQSIGTFEVGDEFHVTGIAGDFYVVEMPDGTSGYIVTTKIEEVTAEPSEETEETEETSETEETTESSETAPSDTTAPADTTAATTAATNAPAATTAPTAAPTAAETAAPAPAETQPAPPPETAPAGPDLNQTYNGNAIGAYDVAGVGTVYGYFVDTSYFNTLVNNHRTEIGLPAWNYTYSDATRTRAIECSVSFSHTRPNGESCLSLFGGAGGEIIYSATDNEGAFNAFMGSDGHRGIIEDSQYYFPNACSAAFVRVEWNGSSWQYAGASLVNNCW